MKAKVLRAIGTYKMLKKGDNVVVAVSGGADSVSLLHFLYSQQALLEISVRACHVNHNLRGEESLRDLHYVQQICQEWDIPLDILEENIAELAKEQGVSEEECGRNVRYAFFEKLSRQYHAKIATAHTMSDSAETVLFNLARGTGLTGLQGIPPVRDTIIRPLIFCTREDIEAYCAHNNINFVTDSTNLQTIYTRNKIRHLAVPVFTEINPAFFEAVSRLSQIAAQDNDCLNSLAKAELKKRTGKIGCDLADFSALPIAIQSRIAANLLHQQGIDASAKNTALLLDVMTGKAMKTQFSEDCFAVKKGIVLSFTSGQPEEETPYYEIPLKEGTFNPINGVIIHVTLRNCENFENFKKSNRNLLKNMLNYDNIKSNAVIRTRQEGDKICLYPRGMTKSLKKLFNEAKIPVAMRAKTPVLADENGVLWVSGFGCDKRAVIQAGCKVLCVTVSYIEK